MNKIKSLITCSILVANFASASNKIDEKVASPADIIKNAPTSDWRKLNPENTLYLELVEGTVVIELNPELAPGHVDNIKLLAREGFYKNLNVYRFVEGFVAQGGDAKETRKPQVGKSAIKAEFYKITKSAQTITLVDDKDGYASRTGFLNGFTVAQNDDATKTWQTHCPGTFAMARGNSADSGGTEFYVALGAIRYLDHNITSFGRVISGMEYIQRLERQPKGDSDLAFKNYNVIKDVKVAADHLKDRPLVIDIMKTESESFKALIKARRNRPEDWFLATPNYTDICAVSVPMRQG
ncbi:peptidyl-prolyl cis-trans isomerase [Pseudoalteromonas sp. NBT06-2]|uniref:peptidylprolyl isomerase n=1 Tax=Pseudoalteromonas sp. NBT06-2 TaxID=2025950 RepID=UPI000BA6F482|nr:peptidylprolyl isomerase [Pseudoalteromonas sp. NBT06-2]PAJ72117.1 peptidyl-prolyl cis-trans isomerase [Pseudoalteromonas sp. NBT06-2]